MTEARGGVTGSDHGKCLLLGVKRKSISGDAMSAYSHKRTYG